MNPRLRPATEADLPFLLRLRMQAMAPHHAAAGIEQSIAEHEARVRDRLDCAQVIDLGAEPVGLLKLLRDQGEWQVMQLQLLPAHQGQGIGSRLLTAVVEQADAAGVGLSLWVLKVNPARRLYERLGFAVVGEEPLAWKMRRLR